MNADTTPSERSACRTVYDGRILRVHLDTFVDPDGRTRQYEIVTHPGAVAILPRLATGEILLVRQERPAVGCMLWEIPAGKLEPGEAPLACARRELREETGYDADDWRERMTFFTTPGFSDERITLFVADRLRSVGIPDPDEIVQCEPFAVDRLLEMIEGGLILDAKTILAIGWLGSHPIEHTE